jgi:hypothetical protein
MLFFVCTLNASNPKENERLPEIGKTFPLLWKADIGRVSFRSNVIFNGNDLIIGSNGNYFMDYFYYDKTLKRIAKFYEKTGLTDDWNNINGSHVPPLSELLKIQQF